MACGACSKKRDLIDKNSPIKGDREYLTTAQIRARLERYKRKFCPDCSKRYDCDYSNYVECKKIK